MNKKIPTESRRSTASRARNLRRSRLCSCAEARARRSSPGSSRQRPAHSLQPFEIPEPLRVDQSELCLALERATLAGGKTGRAAKELMKVLQPHLLREEEDLLQVLGLLAPLARGQISPSLEIISKTERLKTRMFEIAREHTVIIAAARKLLRAARAEKKLEFAGFTEHLMLRAWTDEIVFYPAAILIGEYLKLKIRD